MLIVIAAIIAIIIVNIVYGLIMKILGANVMFFNVWTKIIAYVVVWMVILSIFGMA